MRKENPYFKQHFGPTDLFIELYSRYYLIISHNNVKGKVTTKDTTCHDFN